MHKSSFLVKCRTIKLNDSPMLMAAGTQNAEQSRPSIARTSNVHTSRRRRLPPRNKNKKLLEIRASLLAHLILFCFCAQNGDAADSDQVDEDVNWCFECVSARECPDDNFCLRWNDAQVASMCSREGWRKNRRAIWRTHIRHIASRLDNWVEWLDITIIK